MIDLRFSDEEQEIMDMLQRIGGAENWGQWFDEETVA